MKILTFFSVSSSHVSYSPSWTSSTRTKPTVTKMDTPFPDDTHEDACTTHPGALVVGPATQAHPTQFPRAVETQPRFSFHRESVHTDDRAQ